MKSRSSRRLVCACVFAGALCALPGQAIRQALAQDRDEPATGTAPEVKIPVLAEAPDGQPGEQRPAEPKPATHPGSQIEAKPTKPAPSPSADQPGPDGAMKLLVEGNARWVEGKTSSPNTESERRAMLADKGQTPFATVLTCSDSRLPVERLFDRGVGDIFVVRVAGNVAAGNELGTVEYGIEHLHTPLLVVMGHTKCGAVSAAATRAEVHGHVAELVEQIAPAVERARKANPNADANDLLNAAIRENVWQTIFRLFKNCPDVREEVAKGKLHVVGAVCDIATGRVDWIGEHPWQSELLEGLKVTPAARHEPAAAGAEKGEEH